MEFPDLGEQCAVTSCRMLDFLPVRCSGCQKIFCKDHYCFDCHSCPAENSRERQVPICPLCGVPVPTGPNESADIKVGQHIDTACRSKPASMLKGKIFKNACSVEKCKKKELVPFRCECCHMNFCISHRNEMDHECKGPRQTQTTSRFLNSAVRRAFTRRNNPTRDINNASSVPVVRACQTQQEEEDRQLALALAASYEAEDEEERQRRITPRAELPNQRLRHNQRYPTADTPGSGCSVS